MNANDIKTEVQKRYGSVATRPADGGCCGGQDTATLVGSAIGYASDEFSSVPEGSNLGLGCGNPVALASIAEGETVLDLGSGAGFDCFLAAKRVGAAGRVIGVDMTDEMLSKARENAAKGGYDNVEFREGEIESLPLEDETIDLIMSNCVVNLSPDKPQVFSEAYRVLKPGGRMMISDLVLLEEPPAAIRESAAAYCACVGGASIKDDYLNAIRGAGFQNVEVVEEKSYPVDLFQSDPNLKALADANDESILNWSQLVVSILVRATK